MAACRTFGALLAAVFLATGCQEGKRVVLYCAQDREFAERVLPQFEARTGISVALHCDTEATKSVSLYQQLVREAARPRCDVFWNNEVLGTIRLAEQGLLDPLPSSSAAAFPDWSRPADRSWQAFAARARVLIVNTDLVPPEKVPTSILELTRPEWRGKAAIAKPLFGTTATHAACLFEVLGDAQAREYYRGLRSNGIQVASGNKRVAEGVGQGQYAVGMTDTDDAMAEVQAGRPVKIVFPDQEGIGTLFIPNTLAMPRHGPHPELARRLVEFLLSPEVEQELSRSGGFQIPLNPAVKADLPPELRTPSQARAMQVDFTRAAARWEAVQEFLREEFARP